MIPVFYSPIDRFTDKVLEFLANMPDLTTCEAHILAGIMGCSIPRCDNKPAEKVEEFDLCRECSRKYHRGEWDGR